VLSILTMNEDGRVSGPRWHHLLALPLAAGAMLLLLFVSRAERHRAEARPIPTRGGASARFLIDVPLYKQWDARWGGESIGGSGEEMRRVGCVVSCVAMLFTHYGLDLTPRELNDYLRAHGGYTERGWLRWTTCEKLAEGRAVFDYRGGADHARIDACLAERNPPIVKVVLPGGAPHWVLVVGKEGREYLVNDPLGPEPYPVRLSGLAEFMCAMRVFRPTGRARGR